MEANRQHDRGFRAHKMARQRRDQSLLPLRHPPERQPELLPSPGKPGLYRITIEQDDSIPLVYIGESEFLPKRLGEYARFLHEKKPEGTSARLAAGIRAAAPARNGW
jgi:hypothetical protein